MLAARGAPQLEAGEPAEGKQRLTDGAGRLHARARAGLAAPGPRGGGVREEPAAG
jgi:hypothetical protein